MTGETAQWLVALRHCCSKGFDLSPQIPHATSQWPETIVPGGLMSSIGVCGLLHTCGAYTLPRLTHKNKKQVNPKKNRV